MSMLAERKRKTKWVINPTKNPLWTTDSSGIKFGKELMEKMGWSAGKGLGVNEQGVQEPLKVSYKNDTKGIGYKGNEDDWIEQQEEFNELLNRLRNDNISSNIKISKEERITKSLEEKSKLSKARLHYQKFTRGKDLSKYSDHDIACILGTNKIKTEKSKPEKIIQTEPKVTDKRETSFGVTTISSGYIQDYFKKKWIIDKKSNNSSNKFKDAGEISNENYQKTESGFVKSECNLISDNDEEKLKKRKHKSGFEECLNRNEDETFDLSTFENFKNNVNNKKKKRGLQESDLEEVKIIKRKKNWNDTNVLENENLPKSENHLIDISNYEESKTLVNETDNYISVKKRRKEKNQLDLDVIESGKHGNVAESKEKKNYENNCISEMSFSEKLRTNVEFTLEEEISERREKKKPRKEELKEIDELKNEDCCYNLATSLKSQSGGNVTEFSFEIESVRKKKKKKNKKKYLKNEDIESKNYNCHEKETFYNHGEKKINGIIEKDEDLDINTTEKRKKKKCKKEKFEKEEGINYYTGSLEKFNLEEELRGKSINANKQENILEIQSFRKKKKKQGKAEKLCEIEKADVEFSCDQLKKTVLKGTSNETNINEVLFNATEQENIMESKSYHKKKYKKDKKENKKKEKRETKNINLCTTDSVRMQMQENILELECKKKKRKKERREKLDEKVKAKMQFSCDHVEKPILEEISKETNNNNVNIDSTEVEWGMKEKDVNHNREKTMENRVKLQKPEKIEKHNWEMIDKKIDLSSNNKNNAFHFMINDKMEEGTGVHKHKVELLNEKRADKFYPGQPTTHRVLRLISLSNIAGFKGSNLGSLTGYGFLTKYETNKSRQLLLSNL